MAFGKPAIGTPNQLELRSIASAISNARQRIEQLEQSVSTNAAIAAQSGNTTAILAALRATLGTLSARVTLLESAINSDTIQLTAASAIAAYTPVVAAGASACKSADANDPTAMFAVLGVATTTATVGGTVTVQRRGPLAVPTAAFEVDRAVYVGDLGLTQHPSYESTSIVVGVAVSATELWIAPGEPSLSEVVFASAVDDEYLRYLPVTYQIVRDAITLTAGLFEQPEGIVVFANGGLVTRSLVPEGSIAITNADGVDGNPGIAVATAISAPTGALALVGLAPTVT